MDLDEVPTEIRPTGVKRRLRVPRDPAVKVPRKPRVKKTVPVQGLDPRLFAVLAVVWAGDITTQQGIMSCSLPNCGYPTRCRLSTTGIPICAYCFSFIHEGFNSKGNWVPEKRTRPATPTTKQHIRLRGGPDDMTNVRCATGKKGKEHRWANGFVIEGRYEELYVYDSSAHCYRWWDRS